MKLERMFEKELAPDLRKETADKIRRVRNRPNSFEDIQKNKKSPEHYNEWTTIRESLESVQKDIWSKIFKTEKYKEVVNLINSQLSVKKESDIERIKNEYKKQFDEILKNCPLTPEEREKYLSTESMEQMPLEDYLVLLKRLSGEAFYHVTRYGVREKTLSSTGGSHDAGEGTFVDSLSPLLKDGCINSATAMVTNNPNLFESKIKKDGVKKLKESGKTKEDIIKEITSSWKSDYFLDRESTHFSYGRNLHHYYGGENNYKFYFYYPVEYIMQNDFFHTERNGMKIGQGYYNNRGYIEEAYNDVSIFNFGKGVPINSGILCITDNIEVDPDTGSQYLLKNGKPEIDENGNFKKPEKTISSKEYWENYFKNNPELKPNKIIYGGFGTGTYEKTLELEELANSKQLYLQEENKKEEFKKYEKEKLEEVRKIVTEIIEKYYNE